MPWDNSALEKIAKSDDLHIAPFRSDGTTYGTLTWIWSVVVRDRLFVRAYNGTKSRWYQSATSQKAGHITAAGMDLKVAFEPVSGTLNDEIDHAYRAKYGKSSYLNSMIGDRAQAATVEITPPT